MRQRSNSYPATAMKTTKPPDNPGGFACFASIG
jgi:hypothetical protein